MTTIEVTLSERTERSMFFDIYIAAYCAGAGLDCPIELSPSMRELIWLLSDRYRLEYGTPPPATNDELPGWLLRLANQADAIAPRPPIGWIGRASRDGKP